MPQRSLVALILFMLFTVSLFKILTKEEKNARVKIRRYEDDDVLTLNGQKKDVSTAKI